jgi:hypothetical protein
MPPHKKGGFVHRRQYVERLGDVMDGKTYIVITKKSQESHKRLNRTKRKKRIDAAF